MQYDFGGYKASIANGVDSHPDVASVILERSRALLAKDDLKAASDLLIHALDGTGVPESHVHSTLAVMLACILAAQGHLREAEERLTTVLAYITDRRSAARILCARAVELACEGKLERALEVTARAERFTSDDHEMTILVDDLYAAIVPPLVLNETPTDQALENLRRRALNRLMQRFIAMPTQLHIAHAIALLAERCATTEDMKVLSASVQASEQGSTDVPQTKNDQESTDLWKWAIQCWVLLASSEAYWERWARHVEESRGNYGDSAVDLRSLRESPLERIRRVHERLRDIYRQPEGLLCNPARAERHQRYLVTLETEHISAQLLVDLYGHAPDVLRSSGFVGPVAGVGLLAAIGRAGALEQACQQLDPADGEQKGALSQVVMSMRQCLSPFSPMFTMRRLGWVREAEQYCQLLAEANSEPRAFLCSLM
ncbi:MAG: hypothetical protein ACRDHE_04170, partial [Ktedonobacterales bacterium]